MARDADDVAKVLAYGRENGIPVTFRAGGTSLNGQGQSDGILVDVRRHFGGVAVLDDGARARVKPGTVLGHANRVLAPHGTKLGPDPASTDVATVGGVLANNSGGMRCGVTKDSYSTVRELTFVLPSGTKIDTAALNAAEEFALEEPELYAGLEAIRDEIRADQELSERIRRKFAIKNTTGYRLCAFLDADEPLEIFRRLLIGSEGTLGFIAEAELRDGAAAGGDDHRLGPLPQHRRGDRAGPRAGRGRRHRGRADGRAGADHRRLEHGRGAAGVERAAAGVGGAAGRARRRRRCRPRRPASPARGEILAGHETIRPIEFTREEEEIELAWRVREGLHGLIGRLRLPGTALIVEDVCVPPERIAEGARDLQALLGEHGFLPGVAGHASAGNLHFMLTPDFAKQEDLDRYEAFMNGLVELIVDKYDGSLKAEHGTGINMAPYVEREWGEKATELMWRVKRLADPDGVLSPGRRAEPRRRRPPAQPEDDAAGRGVGHRLRRVRLLRAGLPEPQPDDDAAPADRPAPRDRPPAAGIAAARGAGRGVPVRGARDLRRRRLLPARLPDRDRHRGAGQGAARRGPLRGRRTPGAAPRPPLGHAGGRRPGRAALRRPAGAADQARPRPARRRLEQAAGDPARGRRRRLRALLHEPDLRRLAGAGAGRRLRPGRDAGLDPRRRHRHLLRAALELEGLRRRPPREGERDGRAALGSGAGRGRCRS